MRTLIIADLRYSFRIWAGSLLLLTVVQVCAMWIIGLLTVGVTNLGLVDVTLLAQEAMAAPTPEQLASLLPLAIVNSMTIAFVAFMLVGSITVRNVVNSIVYQRRRVMALWQLAGMTDRQLIGILRGQVALMSVIALLVAAAIALMTVPFALDLLRTSGMLIDPPMITEGIYLGYVLGAALSIAISIISVRGAGTELRAISPLEAMRSEGVRELAMTRKRWTGMFIWAGLCIVLTLVALSTTSMESIDLTALVAAISGVVAVIVGGPVLIIGLMSLWTRIVPPHVSASWFLARQTLLAATSRSVSSVGSISLTIFLFVGLTGTVHSSSAEGDASAFVLLIGFPLITSVTGSVVLVLMAGQQREREIHLAELAGATPAQQKRQALFEAVITVVTGAAIGLFFAALMIAVTIPAKTAATGDASFSLNWSAFGIASALLLTVNILATVIPTVVMHAARDRIAVPE